MSTLPREVIAELSARIHHARAERELHDVLHQRRERLLKVRPVANDLGDEPPLDDAAKYLDMERRWAAEHRWVGAGLLLGVLSWAVIIGAFLYFL